MRDRLKQELLKIDLTDLAHLLDWHRYLQGVSSLCYLNRLWLELLNHNLLRLRCNFLGKSKLQLDYNMLEHIQDQGRSLGYNCRSLCPHCGDRSLQSPCSYRLQNFVDFCLICDRSRESRLHSLYVHILP